MIKLQRNHIAKIMLILYFCSVITVFTGCVADPGIRDNRPQIQNSSLYSAEGTPLRGTAISTEGNEPGEFIMTGDEMRELTEHGLNALHIYAERRSDGKPVGASAENCDTLIDEAEKNNMTVVLTVGEFNLESDSYEDEAQFLYDFWDFYAPRYRDREHVVFEICNEMPTTDGSAEVEAEAYAIIRRHAPDTPVLFYSFAATDYLDTLLPHVEELEDRIGDSALWTNAALAFHGYECQEDLKGADAFRNVIHTLTRKGYPLINTELPNRFEQSHYPDTELLRVCEEEGISWLSFVAWERISVPSIWRGQIEAAGITWDADQGNWPITNALFPFGRHLAWETAESTPVLFVEEYRFIAYKLMSGDRLDFRRLNFGTREPNALCLTVKAEGSGNLSVYAGDRDNTLLGRLQIDNTGGEYTEIEIPLTDSVSGLSNISFVYQAKKSGALYVKSWQFKLPLQASYINPYDRHVFAADFPFHEGEIRRAPSTDRISKAAFQAEGITNGSSMTFDFVEFHGKDVLLHIRVKPAGGGQITVIAGDSRMQVHELGSLNIPSKPTTWKEYTVRLSQQDILMFDPVRQRLALTLNFSGSGNGELFAISEFWFEELK